MYINFKRTYVNTPSGRLYLFRLEDAEKASILKKIQTDWKELIRLHFDAEAGITTTGKRQAWKKLTEPYILFKERENLLEGILEASEPNLMTRYQRSIKYNVKNFSISISFPDLVTGPSRNSSHYANAGVHQPQRVTDEEISSGLGQIKRRIIKKNFTDSFKKRLVEHFTK